MPLISKVYQYRTIIIEDRGHITDPRFLAALNEQGSMGWKHKEEQAVGSSRLAVLLEREIVLSSPKEASDLVEPEVIG